MLTDEMIEYGIKVLDQHDGVSNYDGVRIAYQWLDAQITTKAAKTAAYDLKGMVEEWAGYYISTSDVIVAAFLHPDIRGEFPHYNISRRYTEPSLDRLKGNPEAFTHDYRKNHKRHSYTYYEEKRCRLLISGDKQEDNNEHYR